MAMSKAVKTVADWEAMVSNCLSSPGLKYPTRAFLLHLAFRHMRDGRGGVPRVVSVPRDQLAVELGVSERVVSARFAAAVEAGVLTRLVTGHRGVTATFQGVFPDAGKGVADRHPIESGKGVADRHPMPGDSGNPGVPATNRQTHGLVSDRSSLRPDENPHQRTSERANESDRRPDLPRRSERSDAAERSEDVPAWAATVHDGWCLSGCGTYLNTSEGHATGYCSQHRKDNAA